MVLDHVLYFQVLDHDCAVVLDIGIGGFVQEIPTLVADLCVGFGNQDPGLGSSLRSFLSDDD